MLIAVVTASKMTPSSTAFLAPLTPFRHYVLGDESMEREATPDETVRVAGLLREAIDAGAFGFSTTTLPQHIGYQGRPLACRLASSDELKAYANVLRDAGRGAIEVALTQRAGRMSEDEQGLLEFLLDESMRPVTWLAMASRPDRPEASFENAKLASTTPWGCARNSFSLGNSRSS